MGSQKYAVRVQVDPEKLAGLKVGLDEVATAIRVSNVNLPTGTLYGPRKAFAIEADGQLEDAQAYSKLIVAYRNGAPIRLENLGRALDGVENDKTAAWFATPRTNERAVILAVQKQPGANTVEVTEAIERLLPRFREEIPGSVSLEVLYDRSLTIKESVHDVELTLVFTFALVVMVIFVFLRRAVATVIPSLSMPLAVLATFAVMYLLGYSLNNLSLMALTLSVGFVVDDAIVVLENIVRHVEMGKSPREAAYDASQEIGFTIVSMTRSLVAVFVPFLFMGGILGSLFEEFAVTIAIAILVSGFVSLTLTPMMSALLLKPGEQKQSGWSYRVTERAFEASVALYDRMLGSVLRWRGLTMLFSAAILAATIALFGLMPKGFLPTEDTDQLAITTEAVQGVSFDTVQKAQQRVAEIVRRHPDVAALMSTVGARSGRGGANEGRLVIRLKPRVERKKSAQEIASELGKKLAEVPEMRSFVQIPPPIRLGGRLTKSEYQLTLQATNTEALYDQAPRLQRVLAQSPILADVTTDVELNNPELRLAIDRDRAAALGVSVERIEDTLYSAYGSREVSSIYTATNSYSVILELDPRTSLDPAALELLYVRSDSGELVPLASLAEITRGVGPLTVNHSGQLPAATVSFNLKPGHSLSEAVAAVDDASRKVLTAGVVARFQGSAQAFQSSLTGLGTLLIIAIFVIYLVLGILYESLLHPLTILSALPFAGFGALATLLVFGHELDVYAFVGVILLVGLVKKNGIMMIDFAIEARKNPHVSADAAIREACLVRFRPIMMTTMAALFGTLPIALGIGAGAESRQPLGLAVVGGLLFSQLLTLFVTPVFYVYVERFREWLGRRRHASTGLPAPAGAE